MSPDIVDLTRHLVLREGMFPSGERVLVMVSGGQDSLALLHLLRSELGETSRDLVLSALHVNHALRGQDSEADQTLVESFCRRWEVPLEVRRLPLDKQAGNLQERARELRREAAREVAGRLGATRIALGHTLDDQVETLLYRLGRYGGLRALAGMRPVELPWVRPLLQVRRSQTAEYCRERGIGFAVDRGNLDPGYARTALRRLVVPAWEESLPGAVQAAGRAAEVAAEAAALLEVVLDRLEKQVELPAKDGPTLYSVRRLLSLEEPERRALLRRLLQRLDLEPSRATVLEMERLLQGNGSAQLDVGEGWRATRVYGALRIERLGLARSIPEPTTDPVPLPLPGQARWERFVIKAEFVPGFRAPDVRYEAFVDARATSAGLTVRGQRPGDKLRPLGAPGSRKLKEFFVDARVPAAERAHVPLVFSGDALLWVGGYALGEQGRIRADTAQVVHLTIEGVAPEDEDPYHV